MSNPLDSAIIVDRPELFGPEKPRKEKVFHFLVAGAATVILLAGVKSASGIIGPMLLALFMTIILLVPLRWLRRKGCPNTLSLIIVLGGTVLVFTAIGYFVAKSLNDFIRSVPTYRARIVHKVDELDHKYEQLLTSIGLHRKESDAKTPEPNTDKEKLASAKTSAAPEPKESTPSAETISEEPPPNNEEKSEADRPAEKEGVVSSLITAITTGDHDKEADEDIFAEVEDPEFTKMIEEKSAEKPSLISFDAKSVMYWVTWSLVELRHLVEGGFLVLIFTVFMIFEAARFPEKVDRAFGKEGPINNEHFHRIANDIRRYLFLKAISSLMSAAAATFVYWIFGVPATLFWGIIAFFLYFIPNVGGTLAAIIPGLLIFMTYDIQGVLLYAVCLIIIECSIAYGIEPKMLGHGLGISTVVIILSLFSWGWVLGPIGLFLAAPLTIMVKIILQAFRETEWIAILLSDKVRKPTGV